MRFTLELYNKFDREEVLAGINVPRFFRVAVLHLELREAIDFETKTRVRAPQIVVPRSFRTACWSDIGIQLLIPAPRKPELRHELPLALYEITVSTNVANRLASFRIWNLILTPRKFAPEFKRSMRVGNIRAHHILTRLTDGRTGFACV